MTTPPVAPRPPSESDPDPYPAYAALRSINPVLRVTIGRHNNPAWLITGYDAAREALADPRLSKDTRKAQHIFARRGPARNLNDAVSASMLATDPPEHTRLRRYVSKALTPAAVQRLAPRITQITHDLIDALPRHGTIDLVETLAVPLPVTVICELLGVPHDDREQLHHYSNALFTAGRPDIIDQSSHHIASYMHHLITTKRTNPGPDLLTDLLAADHDTEPLTDKEATSLATLLLIAGHETTTNLIGNATLALLTHPDQLAALHTNPHLMPAAINEFLRYDPPLATATFRWTTQPVRYADTTIPADEVVMISLAAANRDPSRYTDPDILNIHRNPTGHLAFGHGIHHCPGAHLAHLEVAIALTTLLTRHPHTTLAATSANLTHRHTRLMRGLTYLPTTLKPQPSKTSPGFDRGF